MSALETLKGKALAYAKAHAEIDRVHESNVTGDAFVAAIEAHYSTLSTLAAELRPLALALPDDPIAVEVLSAVDARLAMICEDIPEEDFDAEVWKYIAEGASVRAFRRLILGAPS